MAVGVSCAGTGLHEAQSVLEPLLKDSVDFVRQGALLALALVLMQQPESRLESFRAHLEKTLADKHEEVMCRMGAIMATGGLCVCERERRGCSVAVHVLSRLLHDMRVTLSSSNRRASLLRMAHTTLLP